MFQWSQGDSGGGRVAVSNGVERSRSVRLQAEFVWSWPEKLAGGFL